MEKIWEVNWQDTFVPSVSLLELFVRGTLIYLFCFVVLRFTRRGIGGLSISDLLIVVIIADAAQNGMSGGYKSVTDGVFLIGTLVFWSYALDWLANRYPSIEKLLYPAPVLLIKDGRVLRRNLQKELVTYDELMSQLRQQGAATIAEVKRCYIEGDGSISVLKFDGDTPGHGTKHIQH